MNALMSSALIDLEHSNKLIDQLSAAFTENRATRQELLPLPWETLQKARKSFPELRALFLKIHNLSDLVADQVIPANLQKQLYQQREQSNQLVRGAMEILRELDQITFPMWLSAFVARPLTVICIALIRREIERNVSDLYISVTKEDKANVERWKSVLERNEDFGKICELDSANYDRSRGVRVDWETLRAKTSA